MEFGWKFSGTQRHPVACAKQETVKDGTVEDKAVE